MEDELTCIASDQFELLAYGTKSKKVMMQKIQYEMNGDNEIKFEGAPTLALSFDSPV